MTYLESLTLAGVAIFLLHTAGAMLALHAIFYSRTPQGSAGWALTLVFFPYVAIPLYAVFGRSKFRGYIESRRGVEREFAELLSGLKPFGSMSHADLIGEAARFEPLEKLAQMPFTRANSAELLVDGEECFSAIFAEIEGASSYVLLQFFIVHDDALGQELKAKLQAAAARGVRVYFLYDEIGSRKLPKSYRREMKDSGVAFRRFKTATGWRNRFQINFRNHRKIVIADGRVAIAGGLNVGDEYMGRSSRFGHWRDTMVRFSGPAALCAQYSFLEDWYWATRELPTLEWQAEGDGSRSVLVLPTSPSDKLETCGLFFAHAINAAKRRVWITSPYFVPDLQVIAALQLAALRGVDVRIMLPARPDHLLVYLSSFTFIEDMGAEGVKFFRYERGFLHQKVILVDDDFAAVGTANLDNRSFRLNFEITVACADEGFAAEVAAMLEKDFAGCRKASAGETARRPFLFRLATRVARLLAPIQ